MGSIIKFSKKLIKKLRNNFTFETVELRRLNKIPRYAPGVTNIFNFNFHYVDSLSFANQYKEIFIKQCYKFNTTDAKPYIIDCGANVGVSILYLKKLYPEAEIIAFEPDNDIYAVLSTNISLFKNGENVTLVNKAVWDREGEINFVADGADGGAILHSDSGHTGDTRVKNINTVRLKNYLNRKVNFLKIDIEGAESVVIDDCDSSLQNVEHIFIEYHSHFIEDQKLDSILNVLSKNNFRYYLESGTITNVSPLINRRVVNRYDNFLSIYACNTNFKA